MGLLVLALGCGGVVAERSVGTNRVEIRGQSPAYEGELGRILDELARAIEETRAVLPMEDFAITVTLDARRAIAGYGAGGHSPDDQTVWLSLAPAMSETPDLIGERLPRVLIHELHQAIRLRDPGYGQTLLAGMISEGLADHFVLLVRGGEPAPWSLAMGPESAASLRERAAESLDEERYSHDKWFFGSDPTIPKWTGYSLGFQLVAAYLAAHPEASAASLVHASSELFRPDW